MPKSEHLKNVQAESDAVLEEEDSTGRGAIKPWDPSRIRITTKSFSLRDVVDQIQDSDIDLSPDFQREYVWKPRQRTRLIESILLGIPLPAFYFNQGSDGTFQVVDGVQRLSTISSFMSDHHVLDGADLEYLNDLDAKTYSQLDPASLRRFRSTQIVVHIIEPQTPDEVKYDIFNRVNTLGSPLSSQEIRHAMSKERSRSFLKRLIELPEFDLATEYFYWSQNKEDSGFVRHSARMSNRELALRFCAFRNFSEETYRQHASLDSYLIDYTRRLDGDLESESPLSQEDLDRLGTDFERAMINARYILGSAAFRRWPHGQQRRGPINRAIFEAQANALADFTLNSLLPHKDQITDIFREAFSDPAYLRSVTVATGDTKAVSTRMEVNRMLLRMIVE